MPGSTGLKTLIADRAMDATAREYAQYYTVRDAHDKAVAEHGQDPHPVLLLTLT